MAFDSSIGKVLLFGGGNVQNMADTWLWDGSNWDQLSLALEPPGRNVATMAYDSATQQMILFGGTGAPNDTWAFTTATTATTTPPTFTGSVNGFTTNLPNSPYGDAAKQMLGQLPKDIILRSAGIPACFLRASGAFQEENARGLIVVWSVEPTSQYLRWPPRQREAVAQIVENYLEGLVAHSRALYLDDLQSDRIPLQGSADLSSLWGVRIESRSTLDQTMSFQVAEESLPKTNLSTTWSNVPGTSRRTSVTEALSNLLYYTKSVAA